MFKAADVERKIREINLLIDMKINLSSCRTSDHYFSLSLQRLSWDSLKTKNVPSTHANFLEGKQVPAEIIQSSSLCTLQKKSSKHNDCLLRPYRNGRLGDTQWTISLMPKITFKQIVEVLFQCF